MTFGSVVARVALIFFILSLAWVLIACFLYIVGTLVWGALQ